jgi:hypothetical protein
VKQLYCQLSQDAMSEIRRKVLHARRAKQIGITRADGAIAAEIADHDHSIIKAFIEEEFESFVVDLFEVRSRPDPWPDIHSWDYPGEWVSEISQTIETYLEGDKKGYIYSKSGLYTLYIERSDS